MKAVIIEYTVAYQRSHTYQCFCHWGFFFPVSTAMTVKDGWWMWHSPPEWWTTCTQTLTAPWWWTWRAPWRRRRLVSPPTPPPSVPFTLWPRVRRRQRFFHCLCSHFIDSYLSLCQRSRGQCWVSSSHVSLLLRRSGRQQCKWLHSPCVGLWSEQKQWEESRWSALGNAEWNNQQ